MNAFEQLRGKHPLVVYVDLKSPYAFISIAPTRAMAKAAGVRIEWRPFTLDIPSYLGSARLGSDGKVVESNRSASQWGGVKYAYRDARRYARLGGHVLRGTEKIWDSSLAGIGLLWAKRFGDSVADAYLDICYPPFWQRALDIEDIAVITDRLAAAGAATEGFASFAEGPGRAAHDEINEAAFAAGIFGVPSYLVADEFWFGREHLPRVAWLLGGKVGPAPDIAYPLPTDPRSVDAGIDCPPLDGTLPLMLEVAIDIRDPRAWLAWAPTRAMAAAVGARLDWLPFVSYRPGAPPTRQPIEDRGTAHRRIRAEFRDRDVRVYARDRGLPLEAPDRDADATLVHLAMLWLRERDSAQVEPFVAQVLTDYWSGTVDPTSMAEVLERLAFAGDAADGFSDWVTGAGPERLARLRERLLEAGVMGGPTYLLAGAPYQGMGHLPLLRALCGG